MVGFPRNDGGTANQLILFITNPESSAVSFKVTPIDLSRNISNSTTVSIPSNFEVLSVNERNKGILFEADGNVNVFGVSYGQFSADAYLALPCIAMAVDEYEYYGISYDVLTSNYPSVILVVACENKTVVKFDSSTITLNSMETYVVVTSQEQE